MPDSGVFEWTCAAIEAATSLDRLEARGTVRLALKSKGLDVAEVTGDQMKTVILRVLPGEFAARAVEEAESVCEGLAERLAVKNFAAASDEGDSPETIFARLGAS